MEIYSPTLNLIRRLQNLTIRLSVSHSFGRLYVSLVLYLLESKTIFRAYDVMCITDDNYNINGVLVIITTTFNIQLRNSH